MAKAEPGPQDDQEYVRDRWVGECEAAGVYSRRTPVFHYAEKPTMAVTVTRSELWLLAQRHLNTVLMYSEYSEWNGECDALPFERATLHELRFRQLCEQLPPEDQKRFQQQIEIRQRYIRSVAAEVERSYKAEGEFWDRVDAGMVSEAEVAAHKTPPFISSCGVMPAPADGGRGPEEWDIFGCYEENPFEGPHDVTNNEA
jgi:hypothetical protein